MKKMFILALIIGAVACSILVPSNGFVNGMYPSMYPPSLPSPPVFTPTKEPLLPPQTTEPTDMPEISYIICGDQPSVAISPVVITKTDSWVRNIVITKPILYSNNNIKFLLR